MTRTIHIAHFDDEPARVSWLPEALLDFYIDNHGPIDNTKITLENHYRKDGYLLILPVSMHAFTINIHYEIIPTKEAFLNFVTHTPPEIVILDMMQAVKNGIRTTGLEIFNDLSQVKSLDASYISHTAYPEVLSQITSRNNKVVSFPKPANGALMISHISYLINKIVESFQKNL